jgi:acetyltransferase-like isoleucine patch superfamily enzyme
MSNASILDELKAHAFLPGGRFNYCHVDLQLPLAGTASAVVRQSIEKKQDGFPVQIALTGQGLTWLFAGHRDAALIDDVVALTGRGVTVGANRISGRWVRGRANSYRYHIYEVHLDGPLSALA